MKNTFGLGSGLSGGFGRAMALAVVVAAGTAVALSQPAPSESTKVEPAKSEPVKSEPGKTEPAKEVPAGETKPAAEAEAKVDAYVLNFTMKDIEGKDQDLSQYKGKVVLIVNTASRCGFTPQYKGLETLYESKKGAGLVVLGFPSNDFGGQEPGTDEEIKAFCSTRFNVTFPMFSKVPVKGPTAHPLYKKLAAQPAPVGGEPGWNFTKFLVDREGKVVARFDSRVRPDSQELVNRVDELLAAK